MSLKGLQGIARVIGLMLAAFLVGLLPFLVTRSVAPRKAIKVSQTMLIKGHTMGGSYSIRYQSPRNAHRTAHTVTTEEVQKAIDRELDHISRQTSTYRPDSEVSLFNAHRSTDWFSVSMETAEVVNKAQYISNLSQGKFDMTVLPLVRAWGFGPAQSKRQIPSEETVKNLAAHVGWELVEVQLQPPALRKKDPQVEIDLSGIAKGYACDRISNLLSELDIRNHLVEIGGEIVTKGLSAETDFWQVGLECPVSSRESSAQSSIHHVLNLSEGAIATSGDYRNSYKNGRRRLSHTIDPRTGHPIEHNLAAVSVIAEDCATADGLATALMASGPAAGLDLAEKHRLCALFVVREEDKFRSVATTEFKHRFPEFSAP